MKIPRAMFCLLLVLSLAVEAAPQAQPAPIAAIKAGRLTNPETGTVATNQVIIIEGEKIVGVGAKLAIPAGATVLVF